jgi:alanine dehydrogenase
MDANRAIRIGLPRTLQEPGERRDFLPSLVGALTREGTEVYVETGLGAGMGYRDDDYRAMSERVHVVTRPAAFEQDVVLILRAPDGDLSLMRPGALLMSMLHFPTHRARARRLHSMGIDAIALDMIIDEDGRRMVENIQAVAWNGLATAFQELERQRPGVWEHRLNPVSVLVLGAGRVGKHAVEAATKLGSVARNQRCLDQGYPGTAVTVVGRNVTEVPTALRALLERADILVDATQRHQPRIPVVHNAWLELLPPWAIICDLATDPYLPSDQPPVVRGIEGIPLGNLDHFVFLRDDPAWENTVPAGTPSAQRRTVVSCYSWPGIEPHACMEKYDRQLEPLLQTLIRRGDRRFLRSDGDYFERALARAQLSSWLQTTSVEVDMEVIA